VQLLATIGKLIDTQKAAKFMTTYFAQIKELSKEEIFSARIRFMFQDLLELRTNNWTPRREENVPKTLQEVHHEAMIKQYEDELNITKPSVPRTIHTQSQSTQQQLSSTPPKLSPPSMDEWQTVGGVSKKKNGGKKKKKPGQHSPSPSPSTLSPVTTPRLDDSTLEQRLTELLEDYISSGDVADTVLALRELKIPLHKFVEVCTMTTLEQKDQEREMAGKLFNILAKEEKLLLEEHFIRGFTAITAMIDDVEVDIPMAPKLLAKFIDDGIHEGYLPVSYADSLPAKIKPFVQQHLPNK